MRQVIIFLASGAYTGYSPAASGTAGAIVGLLIGYFVLAPIWMRSPDTFVMAFIVVFIASCWVAGSAEKIFGEHDSSKIVIDEVLGMIATMFMNPTGWMWLIAGFVVFRVFDIIKPFPASYFDRRVGGGAGVMLDDLASGIYANLVLQIGRRLL